MFAQSGLGSSGFISNFGGSTNYHGLQVGLNLRVSRTLQFGFAYSWLKAMITDSLLDFVANPLDHRLADYSLLTFDHTQVLTVNYIYNLPAGACNAYQEGRCSPT